MSQPKLSQTVLYEVLVSEVESLKATKRDYDNILSQTSEHLKRLEALYNQPVSVDIKEMQKEHTHIQSTLRNGLYIPQWLGISFICLILGLGFSLFFNYKQYITNQRQQEYYIEYIQPYIEDLEKQVSKNNSTK